MGIPSFYRWLVEKYPLAVSDALEEPQYSTINGVQIPNSSKPNPNGIEFDNLYLDMNGIIHPCFHPENLPPPKSYDDVFKTMFKYIDRIFSIIRPRKLLFLAIDGVAPRAKMNQQRARRFKSAKEAADNASKEEAMRNVFEAEGEKLHSMDSNIITPGTEFMECLSNALQYYIRLRMNTDPGWRGVKVILSDANVVGEGEHKIMSYIRLQRNRRGYDPNTRHCLYGLDADLIMLALASHEVHFSILREDVTKNQNMGNSRRMQEVIKVPRKWNVYIRGASGDGNQDSPMGEIANKEVDDYISRQKFQFFNVWILREYLAHEMNIPNLTVEADLERLLDDFVFMCLFVGNDFLPHVPSLEISEGAIDLLMTTYKKEFVQMGGYLSNSFKVNLKRIEHFMQAVGCHEDAIFRRRSQVQKDRYTHHRNSKPKHPAGAREFPHPKTNSQTFWSSVDLISKSTDHMTASSDDKESKVPLISGTTNGTTETIYNFDAKESKGAPTQAMTNGASETFDNIKLGEEGWKERFYIEKFKVKTEDERGYIRKHAVLKYIEGMCWVMHYYYEGVCSWQWFYPYHYAPFASDFYDLEHLQIDFMLGQPFKPFDQLMGVLPPASAHALPLSYRGLMLDPSSPILDLYPTDFELDMNGKRHEWQAICKLPFIDESRLLTEIAKVEHTLTDEEKRRNSLGMDMLFVHISHPLGSISTFYGQNEGHSKLAKAKAKRTIDPKISGGMNGYMCISDRPARPQEISSPVGDMEKITMNEVLSIFYGYPDRQPHIPRLPKGVVMPRRSVGKEDAPAISVLWHEKAGVLGPVHYERPIAKSVSGSCLVKLAHRVVLEYYADKKKENLDPSVFERLIARFVPSNRTQQKKKPVKKKPGKENHVGGTVAGNRKRKTRSRVACNGKQHNEVSLVPRHNALSNPSCPTPSKSIETTVPVEIENCVASSTSGRKKCKIAVADDKRQEQVKSAVIDGLGALDIPSHPTFPDPMVVCEQTMDVEKPLENEPEQINYVVCEEMMDVEKPLENEPEQMNYVLEPVCGQGSRRKSGKRRAKRKNSNVSLVHGDSAPSDPSCPTQRNLIETINTEEREYSTAATICSRENCRSAAADDVRQEWVSSTVLDCVDVEKCVVTDVASFQTLSNSIEAVHDKNMDSEICLNALQPKGNEENVASDNPNTDHVKSAVIVHEEKMDAELQEDGA